MEKSRSFQQKKPELKSNPKAAPPRTPAYHLPHQHKRDPATRTAPRFPTTHTTPTYIYGKRLVLLLCQPHVGAICNTQTRGASNAEPGPPSADAAPPPRTNRRARTRPALPAPCSSEPRAPPAPQGRSPAPSSTAYRPRPADPPSTALTPGTLTLRRREGRVGQSEEAEPHQPLPQRGGRHPARRAAARGAPTGRGVMASRVGGATEVGTGRPMGVA